MGNTNLTNNKPILNPTELRDYLALLGITTNLSDNQLCNLIRLKFNELTGLIGIDVLPTNHTDIQRNFNDDKILVENYPINEVNSITLNNTTIDANTYTLDNENGIIYLQDNKNGNITVDYTSSLTQNMLQTIFIPLLIEYISINLPEQKYKTGVTSVKEGDVQVNYSTTDNTNANINKRIQQLQSYTTRVKVL